MVDTPLSNQREALIAARLRFSPEAQSVREAAIDGLVKQSLALAKNNALNLPQLDKEVSRDVGSGAVGLPDLKAALARLSRSGDVNATGHGLEGRKYRLTPTAQTELEEVSRLSQARLDRAVASLFRHAPGGSGGYLSPFVNCLAIIFARVADIYIRLLKGQIEPHEFATGSAVTDALQEVAIRFPKIDQKGLSRGIYAFLTEIEPEYDEIKFNMIQNYYISRMLGLDEAGRLLSREVFGESVVYLDTNVFFHALEPQAALYHQFQTLSTACSKLGIQLRVCQISINEHRAVISYHRELVDKVEDQIPEETATKVGSLFYQAYVDAKKHDPEVTTDELFQRFAATREGLSKEHGVELIDDAWFDTQRKSNSTRKLAREIQRQYQEFRPGRVKRDPAAIHDALLLEWVERERATGDGSSWLVTLDSSVCAIFPDKSVGDPRPLGITLDAFLQWISPVAAAEGLEGGMKEIFAEALKYQLLPQDRFLSLDDFLLFAEMEWSCKDLPAEDVENCVRYLRHEAAGLDMTKAADREKVARDFNKFFLDPSRKYQKNLQQLEEALADKEAALAEIRRQADERYQALQAESAEQLKAREEAAARRLEEFRQETARELAQRDALIANLAERADEDRKQRHQDDLRRSAYRRLGVTAFLFVVLEALALWLSTKLRVPPDEITVAVPVPIALFFGWQFIGPERFKRLSWSIRQLFRAEKLEE